MSTDVQLFQNEQGLCLSDGTVELCADFSHLLPRIKPQKLSAELVVRAAKIRDAKHKPARVVDATAGLGEDSFLLAAAGFQVDLYERDQVIARLLEDGLKRALAHPSLSPIASRMTLHAEDSISALQALGYAPDIVLLDPMFPQRTKSASVKKKFQLLHYLEKPCNDEYDLLRAAFASQAQRIIVKRPPKGPYLAGKKPSYSLAGKAVRYDVIDVASSNIQL